MKGVIITDLQKVNDDDRGQVFQFQNRNCSQVLLIKRKKGSVSGKHYHTGKNKLKNPETLVILDGNAKIILRNIKDRNEKMEMVCSKPTMLKISPLIYHEIFALSDIILLDMNSMDDDKDDTIKANF